VYFFSTLEYLAMPFEASCPACGKSYRLKDELDGKTIRCKGCTKAFLVKKTTAMEPDEESRSSVPARKNVTASQRAEAAQSPEKATAAEPKSLDEAIESRPRGRKNESNKAKSSAKTLLVVGAGLCFVFCLGCPTLGLGIWWFSNSGAALDLTGSWPEVHNTGVGPDAAKEVTLHIAGVPTKSAAEKIGLRATKLTEGSTKRSWAHEGDRMTVVLSPVEDPSGLAKKIDFGEVRGVSGRTIMVMAHQADSPLGNDDITIALERLKSRDASEKAKGLGTLYMAKPDKRRAAVAKIVERELEGDSSALAASVLAKWGALESVPALVNGLKSKKTAQERQPFVYALGELRDVRAAAPLADMLETQGASDAVFALKKIGSPAEDAVAAKLKSPQKMARISACDILAQIGTRKSVSALEALNADPDIAVQVSAQAALQRIRSR
jgi:hypothetical protein